MGDINQNGKVEVIAFTKSGKLYIIDSEGAVIFEDTVTEKESIWCARIYKDRLIIGGLDGLLRVFKCTKDNTLEADWAQQFGGSISGILLEDVTGDGHTELLVYSLDKTLRVLNPDNGAYVWGQVFEQGIGDVIIETTKNDPKNKVVYACGNDGTLRAFDGKKGSLLWFRRFSDKMRCVNFSQTEDEVIILCGGDDKQLHCLSKETQEEVKTIQFEDYVWKCKRADISDKQVLIVSTYSFDYLYEEVPIKEMEFTSRLECYNEDVKLKWGLHGKNIEVLYLFQCEDTGCIAAGTTTGELIIINAENGKLLVEYPGQSCINSIAYDAKKKILYYCTDAGEIHALLLELDE